MSNFEIISLVQVSAGAAVLAASVVLALRIRGQVPGWLGGKWRAVIALMIFFVAGYVLFALDLAAGWELPLELVIGTIFMGGAFFVYGVVNISRVSVLEIQQKQLANQSLLETLERRVDERTSQLHDRNKLLQKIISHIPSFVYWKDGESRYLGCNPGFARLVGLEDPSDIVGRINEELSWGGIEGEALLQQERAALESGLPLLHVETTGVDRGGEKAVYLSSVIPLRESSGEVGELLGIIEDVTARKRTEEKLRENQDHLDYLAHHDPLTGLPNRLLLLDRLRQAMAKSRRSKKSVALLFLDLDHFKNVNDSLGHETGDRLLCEVAARLKGCLRETDTVARMGGDEFVAILEQIETPRNVSTVAEKILQHLSAPFLLGGQEIFMTASVGISLYPADAQDLEGLMQMADLAMYRAKDQGRNNFQFYTPEMNTRIQERVRLESSLRRAVDEKHLLLHYQPQVDLVSGLLTGMEALVRWKPPGRELILPGDFIPMAEETGLIVPLGEWVLRTACAQNREWQRRGLSPLRVAVNISARQLKQPNFLAMLDGILLETRLDPVWLELEITESGAMENVEASIQILAELQKRGVKLSIDDFGTGYSSLSYLKRFPLSKLKIDRSFVRDAAGDVHGAAIASSVIALGRTMGLEVVAEGVETADQVQFLIQEGCRQGQGFLFSQPVAAGSMERLLRGEDQLGPAEEKRGAPPALR